MKVSNISKHSRLFVVHNIELKTYKIIEWMRNRSSGSGVHSFKKKTTRGSYWQQKEIWTIITLLIFFLPLFFLVYLIVVMWFCNLNISTRHCTNRISKNYETVFESIWRWGKLLKFLRADGHGMYVKRAKYVMSLLTAWMTKHGLLDVYLFTSKSDFTPV